MAEGVPQLFFISGSRKVEYSESFSQYAAAHGESSVGSPLSKKVPAPKGLGDPNRCFRPFRATM